ncbi:MAG: hypothetical protein WKF50_11100 [Nocardioides sp.]
MLKHDGNTFFNNTRRADDDGDISVDRDRRNTAGRDVFRIEVKRVGSDIACSRTIRLR